MDAIASLLRAPSPPEVPSLAAWLAAEERARAGTPFERAVLGGARADRLGYAFVAGYQAALAALVARAGTPTRPYPGRLCLAVTEEGGGHPRAIATSLVPRADGFVLSGKKTFATLASVSEELLVVGSAGEDPATSKKELKLVRVRASAATMKDRAPLPFAPEIPHALVTFEEVPVTAEDVLPGDGFVRYVRPFRTLEDIHVLAAALAHVVQLGRHVVNAPTFLDEAAALLTALERLAASDPDAPHVHLALAGVFARATAITGDLASGEDDPRLVRFARDLPLLLVASAARAKRREAAARALGLPLRASDP